MTLKSINIEEAVARVRQLLADESGLSPALRAAIEVILLLVALLVERVGITSRNSSLPPSQDPNRPKKSRQNTEGKKPGGQPGHKGHYLALTEHPDEVERLPLDRSTLPTGDYQPAAAEVRQVIDIQIRRVVTEYQAEVWVNAAGLRFVAPFPDGVNSPVQYGRSLKAQAVYLSQFQLLPYQRTEDYFADQVGIPVSAGSLVRFNAEAAQRLIPFEDWLIKKMAGEKVLHADETSVNINGKKQWLHCTGNTLYTYFTVHEKRGKVAMDEAGVLPAFNGTLIHDHWKPYFSYTAMDHSLCNAHHLRELEKVAETEQVRWAAAMQALLCAMNQAVDKGGGRLEHAEAEAFRQQYRTLLEGAEAESPPPDESQRKPGQKGRLKRSKGRNLLERLRHFETETLRFLENPCVPFTNNQGENDIRMTKVHQKISGCFRSQEGAVTFCRVRSYLSTCRKQGMTATEALTLLFQGTLPDFMKEGAE